MELLAHACHLYGGAVSPHSPIGVNTDAGSIPPLPPAGTGAGYFRQFHDLRHRVAYSGMIDELVWDWGRVVWEKPQTARSLCGFCQGHLPSMKAPAVVMWAPNRWSITLCQDCFKLLQESTLAKC